MTKRKGFFPDPTAGWVVLSEYTDGWVLFIKEGSKGWSNLRLVKKGYADHKANYSLGWNGERFAKNKDIDLLMENRPELYERVRFEVV